MRLLLDYMYKGSISVKQNQLSEILESASTLQIRGLNYEDYHFPLVAGTKSSIHKNSMSSGKYLY